MDTTKLGRNRYGKTDNWDENEEEMGPEEFLRSKQLREKLGRKDQGNDSKPEGIKAKVNPNRPQDIGKAQGQKRAADQAKATTGEGIKIDGEFLVDASDPLGTAMQRLSESEGQNVNIGGPTVNSKNPAVNARNAQRILEQMKARNPGNRAEAGIEYFKAKYPKLSQASGSFKGKYDQAVYDQTGTTMGQYDPKTDTSYVFNHGNRDAMPDYVETATHENQHARQIKHQGRANEFHKDKYYRPEAGEKLAVGLNVKDDDFADALSDHSYKMYESQPVEAEAMKAGGTSRKTYGKFIGAMDDKSLADAGEFFDNPRFREKNNRPTFETPFDTDGPEMRSFYGTDGKKNIPLGKGEYHNNLAKKLGYRNDTEAIQKGKFIRVRDTEVELPEGFDLDHKSIREALHLALKDLEKQGSKEQLFHVIQGGKQKTYDIFDLRQALNGKKKLSSIKPMLDDGEDFFTAGSGGWD